MYSERGRPSVPPESAPEEPAVLRAAGLQVPVPVVPGPGAEAAPVRPKVLEALARTKYTTLVDVYDYVDVEEMRRYVERNGDQRTETATQQR